MHSLFLTSPTLPPGKVVSLDIHDQNAMDHVKKNPIVIKEGVEYKWVPFVCCMDSPLIGLTVLA